MNAIIKPSVLALLVAGSSWACSESTGPSPEDINVGLQNSTSASLEVQILNLGTTMTETFFAPPGYTAVEVLGAPGNKLRLTASGGGLSGEIECTATAAIVGTDLYGQVNFVDAGSSFVLQCATEWEES